MRLECLAKIFFSHLQMMLVFMNTIYRYTSMFINNIHKQILLSILKFFYYRQTSFFYSSTCIEVVKLIIVLF